MWITIKHEEEVANNFDLEESKRTNALRKNIKII